MSDIRRRRNEIEFRYRKEREILLKERNERYHDEIAALRKECEKEGHVRGDLHDNGLGWTWYWCVKCGASFDKVCYWSEDEKNDD